MFHSDNPAYDWDRYCDYLESEEKRWVEEHWETIDNAKETIRWIDILVKELKTKKIKTKSQFIPQLEEAKEITYYSLEERKTKGIDWEFEEENNYREIPVKERLLELELELEYLKKDILDEYGEYIKG